MRRGVDYSWGRPRPEVLVTRGFTFAVRYLSTFEPHAGKNLTRAEAEALSVAGLDVVLVFENQAADFLTDSTATGRRHAAAAVLQATELGCPADRPIYFAVDKDPRPTTARTAALAYLAGVKAEMRGRPFGVYGGHAIVKAALDAGVCRHGWQTFAWSAGQWDARAQLRQVQNGQFVDGAEVDFNEAHADDFGQWRTGDTMAWRLANSLGKLRDQVNVAAPARSKLSDGTIGDAAHQATDSDHNPRVVSGLGSTPVVLAIDLTHDPAHGADMGKISEALRLSRDPRIAYVIFNRRVFSATNTPWVWRAYTGTNAHTQHMHVSVRRSSIADDTRDWSIGIGFTEAELATLDDIKAGVDAIHDALWKGGSWMGDEVAAEYNVAAGPSPRNAHNSLVEQLKAVRGELAKVKAGQSPVSDDQAAAIAQKIASHLAAAPDVPLGDADKPAIVAAVKQALSEGTD